jgi:uncharacterized repeat protein (TIGR03803 family)
MARTIKQNYWAFILVAFALCALPATSFAQTFTTLASFNGTNGSEPMVALVQGTDGNLYGTTLFGGTDGDGTVFRMTPSGTVTTLYSFTSANDGRYPYAPLVLGFDGNFYGTTSGAGANNFYGTVFKITPNGTLTTLHSFDSIDGSTSVGALVQASNGTFYGTTESGGANNKGTIFKMTPQGALTTLHSFAGTDGEFPSAALVQGSDGNFYGTTYAGGTNNIGTIFKITPAGTLTTLHNFTGFPTDGSEPSAALIQAANGTFYGATGSGGVNDFGTIFTMTSAGVVTLLHSFNGNDGGGPEAPLIQATNGIFYGTVNSDGTTSSGCTEGCGTVFEITSAGTLTTLLDFDQIDGAFPFAALLQSTSGIFYGTTQQGGTANQGVVFKMAAGLGPFVSPLPTSGKVGSRVIILGNNLTGATAVTFNGTAATFTVVSKTEITTTVPAGATNGKIQVTTPTTTLKSNVVFRVTG